MRAYFNDNEHLVVEAETVAEVMALKSFTEWDLWRLNVIIHAAVMPEPVRKDLLAMADMLDPPKPDYKPECQEYCSGCEAVDCGKRTRERIPPKPPEAPPNRTIGWSGETKESKAKTEKWKMDMGIKGTPAVREFTTKQDIQFLARLNKIETDKLEFRLEQAERANVTLNRLVKDRDAVIECNKETRDDYCEDIRKLLIQIRDKDSAIEKYVSQLKDKNAEIADKDKAIRQLTDKLCERKPQIQGPR